MGECTKSLQLLVLVPFLYKQAQKYNGTNLRKSVTVSGVNNIFRNASVDLVMITMARSFHKVYALLYLP